MDEARSRLLALVGLVLSESYVTSSEDSRINEHRGDPRVSSGGDHSSEEKPDPTQDGNKHLWNV